MPLVETRPLSDDECTTLQQCLRKARRRRRITRLTAWLAPCAIIAVLIFAYGKSGENQVPDWLGGAVSFGGMLVIAVTILLGADAKRRLRLLESSAQSSVVEVFSEPDKIEEDWSMPDSVIRIPETGLLVNSLNPGWKTLITAEVESAAMPVPRRTDAPLHPQRVSLLAGKVCPRRQLNQEELGDLRTLLKKQTHIPWLFWLLFAYVSFGVVASVTSTRSVLTTVRGVMYAGYDLVFVVACIRAVWLRTKFKKDIAEGMVLQITENYVNQEVLPVSGFVWTVEGAPSPARAFGVEPKLH